MGSSSSKQAKHRAIRPGKSGTRAEPPKEKHHSADSQAPLAKHAAYFANPRAASLERHRSIASGITPQHTRTRSNEDEIQPAPRSPCLESAPHAHLHEAKRNSNVDDIEGHSNVTRPPPPPRLHQLSELIDPAELPIDCHIRSPSGTMLALEQFLVHPDRPRSIRERQEEIKEKVRAASRLGVELRK